MSALSVLEALFAFFAVSALSAVMVFLVMRVAVQRNMVDFPGERQSHTKPTPTGGGLGLVATLVLTSLMLARNGLIAPPWTLVVLPGLSVLALVGWRDDFSPVSVRFRLFVQLTVSLALLALLRNSDQLENWPATLLGGVAIMWTMNFYNFMDGSHGMAGFQGLFTGLLLGFLFSIDGHLQLAIPAFLLAACCAGFLPFNFPVPRVFMGDAGSVPLGFALATLILLGLLQGALSLPEALLLLSVFLIDSSLTLFKRAIQGERWYTAHKQHVYQRLIAHGWSHSRVLLLYQAINAVVVAPVVILVRMYPEYAWHLTGMTIFLMIAGWYLASLRLGVQK